MKLRSVIIGLRCQLLNCMEQTICLHVSVYIEIKMSSKSKLQRVLLQKVPYTPLIITPLNHQTREQVCSF